MSSSQMLKGVLEGYLLAVISKGEIYGYEMIDLSSPASNEKRGACYHHY